MSLASGLLSAYFGPGGQQVALMFHGAEIKGYTRPTVGTGGWRITGNTASTTVTFNLTADVTFDGICLYVDGGYEALVGFDKPFTVPAGTRYEDTFTVTLKV